jgi:multidrug efflux system membrane fusion protein
MRTVALLVAVLSFTPARAQDKKTDPGEVIVTGRTEGIVTEIRPRVSGFVEAIRVKEGELVKRGQVLAELDPRAFQIELEKAKARLVKAEVQAKITDARFERLKALVATGIVPQEEVDQAASEREVSRAELMLAQAELKLAGLHLSWTKVTAPTDGRVGHRLVTEGSIVKAETDLLTTIVRDDVLTVVCEIDERSLLKLREGLRGGGKPVAEVALSTDKGFPRVAEFRAVDQSFDPKTGTIRVRATLPNPKGDLTGGLFVRVRLTVAPKTDK